MILAITGTPATGKSTVAARLSGITGWKLVGLNELAESGGLFTGYDDKRGCKVVDLDALRDEIARISSKSINLIMESHYSHDIPADLVVVLRANPEEIRKRAKEKGWKHTKTEENVVAEIMEECKIDAMLQGRKMVEFDTTGKTSDESARGIAQLLHDEGMFLLHDVKIPDDLREKLREPYGDIFSDMVKAAEKMKGTDIIAVGDYVSYLLYSHGIMPKVFVTDGKVRRKPYYKQIPLDYETVRARNEPGCITNELWMAAQQALETGNPARIVVEGEEDMAVLPLVLLAKEGSSVIYGLFDKGSCVIKVGENERKAARNLLRRIVSSHS
jgi:uncharacterized protein (UPF0218 family)/cytidylate kinase